MHEDIETYGYAEHARDRDHDGFIQGQPKHEYQMPRILRWSRAIARGTKRLEQTPGEVGGCPATRTEEPGDDIANVSGIVPFAARTCLPQAVLWDLDGTLIDSEPYWHLSKCEIAAEYGISWSEADEMNVVGHTLTRSASALRSRGVPLGIEEIVQRRVQRVASLMVEPLPWMPGAKELLSLLAARGVPCGLVTNSHADIARRVADGASGAVFDVTVSGDEVSQGKPHPEPYLKAIGVLGVDPARCVAVEDSLTGVRSAEAAGLNVLAVPGAAPVPPDPGRSRMVSLKAVTPEILAAISGGMVIDHLRDV